MSLLENINSPDDLKKLSKNELPHLAEEMREFLIDSVSKTGGHIAPSLGVVELTIALHYTFSTPKDKFVWDVGHQAYPHKIITGRRDQFPTLRQYKGMSGFPHITESEHDAITVGHASTSISAAFGMAKARDMQGEDNNVIAIIGDGALTGGLALEGLNNLGHSNTKMTVILNDNEMSIAPNVGGLSKYLTKILTDKKVNRLKTDVWKLLDHFSKVGKVAQKAVSTFDDTVKHIINHGSFFEDMGIRYIGPIDGHNYDELLAAFEFARDINEGPLLLHILTEKGKGYSPAEENRPKFHGLGAFEKETGEVISTPSEKVSWSKVFGDAMIELANNDPKVCAITAAMPDGTGLGEFRKVHPDRLIDTGIAEGHAVTFSAGMALSGMKPVVAIYSTFLQRAYDHIIHDVALDNTSVVFCIDRAGVVGNDGPTHHGFLDLSFLRTVPGATIMAPSTAEDLRNMLYSALYEMQGPVFIRYPRGTTLDKKAPFEGSSYFKPTYVKDEKSSVLIISAGHFRPEAEKVVDELQDSGTSCALVDLRTVKPLDKEFFTQAFSQFNAIVSLEQNAIVGGVGSAITELATELYEEEAITTLPKVLSIGYPDHFVEQGSIDELQVEMELTAEFLVPRIEKWLKR